MRIEPLKGKKLSYGFDTDTSTCRQKAAFMILMGSLVGFTHMS